MKYVLLIVICLFLGGMINCAPTSSQPTSAGVSDENVTRAVPTSAPLVHPSATTTPTPTLPVSPATEESKPLPTEAAPAPTNTLLPQPSATPLPTHTPTLQPTALPTTGVTPAVSVASADNEAQIKRGLEIYKQLYCGLCHKFDVAGTAGTFGPPHNHLGTEAEQWIQDSRYTGKATTAAEYIHESIVDPKAFLVPDYEQTPHQMPVYNYLSEADVAALVQLLLQQK